MNKRVYGDDVRNDWEQGATLSQLANQYDVDASVIKAMLQHGMDEYYEKDPSNDADFKNGILRGGQIDIPGEANNQLGVIFIAIMIIVTIGGLVEWAFLGTTRFAIIAFVLLSIRGMFRLLGAYERGRRWPLIVLVLVAIAGVLIELF